MFITELRGIVDTHGTLVGMWGRRRERSVLWGWEAASCCHATLVPGAGGGLSVTLRRAQSWEEWPRGITWVVIVYKATCSAFSQEIFIISSL